MSEFLSRLNPEQAEAAGTINGPVLVLAGAGTGKTRVITFRIAHMLSIGIAPEQILGMTFTNKAAREMRERLAQLVDPGVASRVTLGTFHSFCIRILRREAAKLGYLPGFTIADDSDQQGLLKQAVGNAGFSTREGFPLAEVQAQIGKWKNRLLFPKDAKKFAETSYEEDCAIVYEHYQELLELQNSLDFDDMLLLVHKLFTEFPEVLAKYQDRYRYLLIDEYQDTNAAQFTIVKLLVGETCNLCVVGDDDQSIYSWRGADISNILNFPEHFPGAKVVKLEQNYRSTTSILNAANAVIGSNANRHEKKLWSDLGIGDKVQVVKTASGEAEAEFIVTEVKPQPQSEADNGKEEVQKLEQYARQVEEAVGAYKEVARRYIYSAPMSAAAYFALFQQIDGLLLFDLYDKEDSKAYGAVATSLDHFYPESPRAKHLYNLALQSIKVIRSQRPVNLDNVEKEEVGYVDIELPDIQGVSRKLSALAPGNIVLLNFTAYMSEWSPALNMALGELYVEYHDKGLEVYQVSLDGDVHFWKNAASNLPWTCVRDPQTVYSQVAALYNVKQLPVIFVLDRSGNLVKRVDDMKNLAAEVGALF